MAFVLLISPSFGAIGRLCFMIVGFDNRDQTWFFMDEHSPGPVGGVENRGRRPRFSIPPKEPREC